MNQVIVRPVIELDAEEVIPPLNTIGGNLATEIKQQALLANFSRIPGGWFVPLAVLMDKIESVADYLYYETTYYNEFEVGGGFEIIAENGSHMGVTPGSMFLFATELVEVVRDLHQDKETRRAFIDNDHYLDFTFDKEMLSITTGHASKQIPHVNIIVNAEEFRNSLIAAQKQLEQFAQQIEPLLMRYSDTRIQPQLIKRMFGMAR